MKVFSTFYFLRKEKWFIDRKSIARNEEVENSCWFGRTDGESGQSRNFIFNFSGKVNVKYQTNFVVVGIKTRNESYTQENRFDKRIEEIWRLFIVDNNRTEVTK